MKLLFSITIIMVLINAAYTQTDKNTDAMLFGDVQSEGEHLPFVNIVVVGTSIGASTDATGHFMITDLPLGEITVEASSLGYKTQEKTVIMKKGKTTELFFILVPDYLMTDQVVVSADRNEISRKEAAVIVTSIPPKLLESVNANTLSDGISFSPGLRVESNCQNCGFTQLRMNGLDGPYSQILIDSKPIFSGLAGVYGLEQIPTNMIERIEIVRGGGSALFGGNAIAGTVNIITKDPVVNTFSVGTKFNSIGIGVVDNPANDNTVDFNASVVADNLKSGLYVFGLKRQRDALDLNGDSFSEITQIKNTSVGFRGYVRPTDKSRISLEFHSINEKRRGGNKLEMLPHEADIAEMIDVNINGGSLSYESYLFNETRHKFSAYVSAQELNRDSYYGANRDPDAYGFSHGLTANGGVQFVSKFAKAIFAPSTLTAGIENTYDILEDTKLGAGGNANTLIANQKVNTVGTYIQNKWDLGNVNMLVGLRYDIVAVKDLHDNNGENDFNGNIINPRLSMLYNATKNIQFRASVSTGYRAPQIFDEDLHIEASGSRTILHSNNSDLRMEQSISYTGSVSFEKEFGKVQTELLVEGFYTNLNNAFVTSYFPVDTNGTIMSVRGNADGKTVVSGTNIEINIAPSRAVYFQLGGTAQISQYDKAQQWGEDSLNTTTNILRSPNTYGYIIATWEPIKRFKSSISGNYTGSMYVPHLAGGDNANGELIAYEELVKTQSFFDVNIKLSYSFQVSKGLFLEFAGGVQNIFHSYQTDFDYGINRDAGYVYGPIKPRTLFFSIKLKN